jgi:two-component system KDP operon response regulator KdpE
MPEERVSVLVVAGDASARRSICDTLSTTGFALEESCSAPEASARAIRGSYDLVLIWLGNESSHGFQLCRYLRAALPDLGIVLVRDESAPEDEVRALEAGADDCVSIPFRYRELVGRLRAVLTRPVTRTDDQGAILQSGELKIDTARRICWRGRYQIHLSAREFDLLATLMKQKERALTHVRLLTAVWGPVVKHDADYLRSYIKALRKKIETTPTTPEYIVTVPWVGYLFRNVRRRTGSRQIEVID